MSRSRDRRVDDLHEAEETAGNRGTRLQARVGADRAGSSLDLAVLGRRGFGAPQFKVASGTGTDWTAITRLDMQVEGGTETTMVFASFFCYASALDIPITIALEVDGVVDGANVAWGRITTDVPVCSVGMFPLRLGAGQYRVRVVMTSSVAAFITILSESTQMFAVRLIGRPSHGED